MLFKLPVYASLATAWRFDREQDRLSASSAAEGAHHMQNWGLLIVVIVVISAGLPALMQQGRADVSKTLWLAATLSRLCRPRYRALLLADPSRGGAGKGSTARVAGSLWRAILMRVPRYREPPLADAFGIADFVLSATGFAAFMAGVGCSLIVLANGAALSLE